jgi:cold shock protein
MSGYVKRTGFQPEKGFGFIESGGRDFFFHHSSLIGLVFDESLIELAVEFELERSDKGPRAICVRAA